jgi:hypothetical protein
MKATANTPPAMQPCLNRTLCSGTSRRNKRRDQDRMHLLENLQRKRRENYNFEFSELCNSLIDDKIFDTEILNSIDNAPEFTDMRSEYSINALYLQAGQ